MNEMHSLERQLQSWIPRRPSARLGQRLFAPTGTSPSPVEPASASRRHASQEDGARGLFHHGWLIPATACLMLAGIVLKSPDLRVPLARAESVQPMFAAALSNQTMASFLPGSFDRSQNSVPVETFEWTKAAASTSSIPSLASPIRDK